MPIVRVEMFPGRTHAQKQELARAITEAVANIAHTTPDATIVIFQDVERENWAQGGKLASDDELADAAQGSADGASGLRRRDTASACQAIVGERYSRVQVRI